MPMITIDGVEYEVEAGRNLLESCLSLGLDLPYFCWHPAMGSIGACRQCAVVQYQNAEDTRGRIMMACMTPVTDGAIFSLAGDKAQHFREAVVESLMLNHPHDCPVCAEGGECHLQDMTVMVGHRDRHYRGLKNTHRNQYLGPLINHEMNRCIACYRCTRYYRDYAGGTDLAAMAAHDHVYFGRHQEGVLQSEFAGNLVEVCPTGVFTDKSLVHDYTRKWDLQSAPSVCNGCAVGCNTMPGERYGRLKRVHNRYNAEVNGYFLCDRGRFGASFVNSERGLEYAGLRQQDGRFKALDHHEALLRLTQSCAPGKMAGIGSPRASVEANYLLRELVGADNYAPGFSANEQLLVPLALRLQQNIAAVVPDIKTIESADAVFILGEDVTNTAPRIALALRQSVRNKAYELAAELKLETWQDAAIRNLAQDQRSPLFIATVADTPLDDVAEQRFSLAPQDIAALGRAVAAAITGNFVAGSLQQEASDIATALKGAKRPLIIAGTGCGSADILRAAAKVADALCSSGQQAMLSLCVPEANSLGQAMLAGSDAPDFDVLQQRATAGEIDTLVVLENDLFRRGTRAQIHELLDSFRQVIVLDGMDNDTTSAATLALPAANFVESEGTLVSLEGRAQRYYPVYEPRAERRPSWVWLLACMKELERPEVSHLHHFDDITRDCAANIPDLAGITAAAPDLHYLNLGVKIPRQPPRYSGRTAMRADISVHEPKQREDEETPLAFTMEGLNRTQPGSLLPWVWSPGWNSNQSVQKFQTRPGGALKGGTAGVRLLNAGGSGAATQQSGSDTSDRPSAQTQVGQWQLVPRQRIFGSDELSALSPAIAELTEPGFIEINKADATTLGVSQGDGLHIGDGLATLEVHVNDTVAPGCVGYSAGLAGTDNLTPLALVVLSRAEGWRRRPELIARQSSVGQGAAMSELDTIGFGLLIIAAAVGGAAVLTWFERRLLGVWQDRYGPNRLGPFGIMQVAADMIKLLTKHDWVPPFADRAVFVFAPTAIVVAMLLGFAVVPFGPDLFVLDINIGLLFFLGMTSLAVYSVLLAGLASNNKYALLGGLRSAAQMVSYEVFMGLSLMGVVMLTGSFSLVAIVEAQRDMWFCIPQFLGLFTFMIAGIAESHRLPFDLPEAEHELTAGFHTEYGGMKFAMFMLGEYLGLLLISCMIVTLFFGGYLGPWLPPIVWFGLKVFVVICFFILPRAAIPRPRYDQLMALGWKVMLPLTLLNLVATGAIALWMRGLDMLKSLISQLRTIWTILQHTFTKAETVQYPEEMPYLSPRYRGRIVLTNDPDGEERCVACNLCAVACPVDCIALQQGVKEDGRWYPEFFRINFSRCIMCGMCEEACPTNAIQLTPDFEMCEYDRSNMVYEKEHLQIQGTGKYHTYNFYKVAGLAIDGKGKGEAQHEAPPIDVKSLLP